MALEHWLNIQVVPPFDWTCGHCGLMVGGNMGYKRNDDPSMQPPVVMGPAGSTPVMQRIYICPRCEKPTFIIGGDQVPGVPFGSEVGHLPADIAGLYKEARNCMIVSAFTASVLATRKLLMNVAVSQGAPPNDTFQNYVNFLVSKGYVPPTGKTWVDHIRNKGNEATHEIPPIQRPDAEELLTFMEMILRLVFDYPGRGASHRATTSGS